MMKVASLFLLNSIYAQLLNITTVASGFQNPIGLAVDITGRVIIVESGLNQTLYITPPATIGIIHLSSLSNPSGIAVDKSGDFYFLADSGSNTIKNVSSGASPVVNVIGTGDAGNAEGAVNLCQFSNPSGVAIGNDGSVYIADTNNNAIRILDYNTQLVSTFAGGNGTGFADGTADVATFYNPRGVALDSAGNVFVADSGNNAIRRIDRLTLQVVFFAGSTASGLADGAGTTARFNNPTQIAIDLQDNIYVADTGNNAIRNISSNGVVTTIAGNLTSGYIDGLAYASLFASPGGIAVGANKQLVIADSGNNVVRSLMPLPAAITSIVGNPPNNGGQVTIVVENLNITTIITATVTDSVGFSGLMTGCIPTFSTTNTNLVCTAPAVPYFGPFSVQVLVLDNFGKSLSLTYEEYFYQIPIIASISPNSSDSSGGLLFSITGSNFGSSISTAVMFGPNPCSGATIVSNTLITCIIPVVVYYLNLGCWQFHPSCKAQ